MYAIRSYYAAPQWESKGADGPTDHGEWAGAASVDATQQSVTIDLAVDAFSDSWVNDGHLSILIVPDTAVYCFV